MESYPIFFGSSFPGNVHRYRDLFSANLGKRTGSQVRYSLWCGLLQQKRSQVLKVLVVQKGTLSDKSGTRLLLSA